MPALQSPERYRFRARVAKALAHPTRLVILDALARGELCVNDLTELAGVDQSTVSKHLAILKSSGLVVGRKEGNMSFYSIRSKCVGSFVQIVTCIENVLREELRSQQAALRGR